MWHPSVHTDFIRLCSVTTNRKNGLTGEQFAVGTNSRSVSTGPSQMFSVLTEGCHVGPFREFVRTACCTYGQSNTTIVCCSYVSLSRTMEIVYKNQSDGYSIIVGFDWYHEFSRVWSERFASENFQNTSAERHNTCITFMCCQTRQGKTAV